MQVKFKKLHPDAKPPTKQKTEDAGADLTAVSYEYKDGRHVYGTGLAVEIPKGYVGLVFPRSSICKKDLRLTNGVGVIDSNYRGEIKAFFENDNMYRRGLKPPRYHEEYQETAHLTYQVGERIAQMIILPYPEIEYVEANELSNTERGDKGFGSSGV